MQYRLLILSLFLSFGLQAQISLEKKDESCFGRKDGSIEILFEGTLNNPTYTWTKDGQPFPGQKHIGGLAPGDYSVTVTAKGGCMAFKSARIYPGPEFSVDISARLVDVNPKPVPCGGRPEFTYILTAVPSGGTPPYYCSWGRLDKGAGECAIEVKGKSILANVFMSDSLHCADSDAWEKKGVTKICARDPNDITGPQGYDSMRWISVNDPIDYTVRFENDPIFATSNASAVLITIPLSDNINPFSFRLGSFGFGSNVIEMPANTSYFQQRIDYASELGFLLDVTAGLDLPNNRLFWLLETIDPLTGQPPTDPTAGFLPVNDTLTGSGEGFVNFTVYPNEGTLTGETVQHQASIIFDVNDPILTNTWTNTIDAFPPITTIDPLPDTFNTNVIPFSWIIEDDPGGCGVQHAQIYLSNDNITFESQGFEVDTNENSLTLEWDRWYYYKVTGTDFVENAEEITSDSFYVAPNHAITLLTPDQEDYCLGDTLQLTASLISLADADIYMSTDSGVTYTLLASDYNAWPFAVVLDSPYLQQEIIVRLSNEQANVEALSAAFTVHGLPDLEINGSPHSGCAGDILFAHANGAFSWQWWPDSIIGNPLSAYTNIYTPISQFAWVRGTNEVGCSAIDSVYLTIHPNSLDSITQPLCEGDSIFIDGNWITDEGFYSESLINALGCDSTVVTEVYFESPCIWPGGPYVYVHEDATGLNNGTSWANAFNELQDAIYVAGRYENVQEIWVAEGTYKPHATRRDTSFVLTDSIRIYGGFLGIEASLEDRTANASLVILSGDVGMADTLSDNSFHVVSFATACTTCLLDGLSIEDGRADGITNGNDNGAGVYNQGHGTLYNVRFAHHYAAGLGGAIYSTGMLAELIVENCLFQLNDSSLGRDVVNVNGSILDFRGANSLH
jgi:hypothetical protein